MTIKFLTKMLVPEVSVAVMLPMGAGAYFTAEEHSAIYYTTGASDYSERTITDWRFNQNRNRFEIKAE